MFATLNKLISSLDGGSPELEEDERYGFQVLRNTNSSIPLEPWFDFLIQVAGRDIVSPDPEAIASEVRSCAGGTVLITVWSAKGRRQRTLYLPVPEDASSLGLTFQWEKLSTTNFVWHILDVTPGSPADKAELIPYSDYVIGSPDGLLRHQSALEDLVDDFLNRNLKLYVYNREYDIVRQVTIVPSHSWGGQGRLGCALAFGALHGLPQPLEEPPEAPGETLYETPSAPVMSPPLPGSGPARPAGGHGQDVSSMAQSYIAQYGGASAPQSGADSIATTTTATSGPKPGSGSGTHSSDFVPMPAISIMDSQRSRARRKQGAGTPSSAMMDAYLAAESERSLKLDNAKVDISGTLPPPPKGGSGGAAKSPESERRSTDAKASVSPPLPSPPTSTGAPAPGSGGELAAQAAQPKEEEEPRREEGNGPESTS